MEIGAGGLRRVDPLPEAEVEAEVGAQEAQEAEVGEVEAQGSAVSPRAHHRNHQVGRKFSSRHLYFFFSSKIFKTR